MAKPKGKEKSEIYLDVFTDHFATLVDALPVKSLVAKFVSAKIITFSDLDEILKGETTDERGFRFLRHIGTHLETGNSETFLKMLDIIDKHGRQYAYLAQNIRRDISKRVANVPSSEDHPDNPDVVALTKNEVQGMLHKLNINNCKYRDEVIILFQIIDLHEINDLKYKN